MMTRNVLLFFLLCAFMMLFPACSEDDIPTIPEIPEFEDPVLGTLAAEGAIIAQGLVDVFPAIASGSLVPKDAGDPYWDEVCSCLRWSSSEEHYAGPDDSWYRGWNFAATFFNEGISQMAFSGTDSISVQVGYSFNKNKYTDEDNFLNQYFYMNLVVEIIPLGGAIFGIQGTGSGQLYHNAAIDGEGMEVYEDFTATLLLTYPLGGCPTGMLTLDFDPATYTISFASEGMAYWEWQVGPGASKEGSFPLQCGN